MYSFVPFVNHYGYLYLLVLIKGNIYPITLSSFLKEAGTKNGEYLTTALTRGILSLNLSKDTSRSSLQQTPEPISVGSNTDTVDVISVGLEHSSSEGVKRPAVKKSQTARN